MLSRGRITILTITVALALMALLVIFFGHRMRQELEREFLQRSELMANNFADQVRFRLKDRTSEELPHLQSELQEMTNTFVMGLILYAQIVWRGEVLAEDIATSVINIDLSKGDLPRKWAVERRDGLEYLDIWKALAPEHENSYVRLGLSLVFLRTTIWDALWPVILWGIGLVVVIGLGIYLLWPHWVKLVAPERAHSVGALEFEKEHEPRRVGKLIINDQSKEIRLNGSTISVNPREYALLYLLASEPGRVFSAQEIIERAWGDEKFVTTEDVKKYIYLLRQKLENDPQQPQWIVTVRGFGYKLHMPD